MQKNIQDFAKKLNLKFQDSQLLKIALTHRSYINEHRKENLSHNERLEFLGDAVLELIVTEYLFNKFDKPEGELTNLRAALVKGETLTEVGKKIGLEDYLLLSKGELKAKNRSRNYLIANGVEALIGALYLDQGYEETRKFIHNYIIIELPKIIKNHLYRDPKSLFQEKAQEKIGSTPSYKLIHEKGPDHKKLFKIGAFINSNLIAAGEGRSKQDAEQKAAESALKKKGWLKDK